MKSYSGIPYTTGKQAADDVKTQLVGFIKIPKWLLGLCLITVFYILFVCFSMYKIGDSTTQLYEYPYTVSRKAQEMKTALYGIRISLPSLLATPDITAAQINDLLRKQRAMQDKSLEEITLKFRGNEKELAYLKRCMAELREARKNMVNNLLGNLDFQYINAYYAREVLPHFEKVDKLLGNLGDAAEHRGIRHAVAAQAVGAMHAAAVLARGEKSGRGGRAIDVELDPTHQVVRRRHDLDPAARQVEAAVLAAVDHAGEGPGDLLGTKMAHLDIDAAHGARAPGAHFGINAAADHVARGALAALVVIAHEALARAVGAGVRAGLGGSAVGLPGYPGVPAPPGGLSGAARGCPPRVAPPCPENAGAGPGWARPPCFMCVPLARRCVLPAFQPG